MKPLFPLLFVLLFACQPKKQTAPNTLNYFSNNKNWEELKKDGVRADLILFNKNTKGSIVVIKDLNDDYYKTQTADEFIPGLKILYNDFQLIKKENIDINGLSGFRIDFKKENKPELRYSIVGIYMANVFYSFTLTSLNDYFEYDKEDFLNIVESVDFMQS